MPNDAASGANAVVSCLTYSACSISMVRKLLDDSLLPAAGLSWATRPAPTHSQAISVGRCRARTITLRADVILGG
jgi:hypothetical protein